MVEINFSKKFKTKKYEKKMLDGSGELKKVLREVSDGGSWQKEKRLERDGQGKREMKTASSVWDNKLVVRTPGRIKFALIGAETSRPISHSYNCLT